MWPTPRLWSREFGLACFGYLVVMLGATLPTPIYPLYQQQFNISQWMVTLIYGVYAMGTMAALLGCGGWSDQIGRRPILFAALATSALSSVLFIVGTTIGSLLIARILSGASAGFAAGTATVFIIELAPPTRRHAATLFATGVNSLGLGLGPLLGGLFAQYGPWPTRLVYGVHLALLALAVAAVGKVPETITVSQKANLRIRALALPKAVRRAFIPAAIAGIAGFAVLGFFSALTPAFMRGVLGLQNLALSGLMVFLLFSASAVGQLALALYRDQRAMGTSCVWLASGALMVAASITASSLSLLIAGILLAGIGQGLGFRAGLADITLASPAAQRGAVNSLYFVVLYTALSAPIFGLGLWADAAGLREAGIGFSVIIAALALSTLLALVLLRRRKR